MLMEWWKLLHKTWRGLVDGPTGKYDMFHHECLLLLTVSEQGAGVNFPNDLSFVGSVDSSILIVQEVLRQSLIWKERIHWCFDCVRCYVPSFMISTTGVGLNIWTSKERADVMDTVEAPDSTGSLITPPAQTPVAPARHSPLFLAAIHGDPLQSSSVNLNFEHCVPQDVVFCLLVPLPSRTALLVWTWIRLSDSDCFFLV